MLVFAVTLLTNLYKKAMIFERGHSNPDPEKTAYLNQIDEIQEKVEEIYKQGQNYDTDHDLEFKNQKIIAWLLNRNKEAQSGERMAFFKSINDELKNE